MTNPASQSPRLPVSELRQRRETPFLREPDAEARRAIAGELGLETLRKLRFEGSLAPKGAHGWLLSARLGATVVQPCVVTLEPVTTRIDTDVARHFLPESEIEGFEEGSETEMPDDESLEPLGEVIDLDAILLEALSLALPAYPRKQGAELGEAVFSEAGTAPLRDEDIKPFAGLAALREKMQGKGD